MPRATKIEQRPLSHVNVVEPSIFCVPTHPNKFDGLIEPAEEKPDPYTLELLTFPDDNNNNKLTCWNYNEYLFGGRHCRCNGPKSCDYLHTGGPKTSLICILEMLAVAQIKIDLCIFFFSLEEVAKLLIKLNRDLHIRIRVICDPGRMEDDKKKDQIPLLIKAGIQVRERQYSSDRHRPLMHHKFVVVDDRHALMGSFNWTRQAVEKNNESVMRTDKPEFVAQLRREFNKLWAHPDFHPAEAKTTRAPGTAISVS